MPKLKCPTCDNDCDVKAAKNSGNPYVYCPNCNTQILPRGKQAIEKFIARYGKPGAGGAPQPKPENGKGTDSAPSKKDPYDY